MDKKRWVAGRSPKNSYFCPHSGWKMSTLRKVGGQKGWKFCSYWMSPYNKFHSSKFLVCCKFESTVKLSDKEIFGYPKIVP